MNVSSEFKGALLNVMASSTTMNVHESQSDTIPFFWFCPSLQYFKNQHVFLGFIFNIIYFIYWPIYFSDQKSNGLYQKSRFLYEIDDIAYTNIGQTPVDSFDEKWEI